MQLLLVPPSLPFPARFSLSKISETSLLAALEEEGRCWLIRDVSLGGEEVTPSPPGQWKCSSPPGLGECRWDKPSSLAKGTWRTGTHHFCHPKGMARMAFPAHGTQREWLDTLK